MATSDRPADGTTGTVGPVNPIVLGRDRRSRHAGVDES